MVKRAIPIVKWEQWLYIKLAFLKDAYNDALV